MWDIGMLTTRIHGGVYKVRLKHGSFSYVMDDFGNLSPANGVTYLIGY